MITYRVYLKETGPRGWVEYVDADSPEAALAEIEEDRTEWPKFEALPLPDEMKYECVCSEDPVPFKRIPNENYPDHSPYSHLWQCQNCQNTFNLPPDEIDFNHLYQCYYDDECDDGYGSPYYERDGYYEMEG